MTEHEDYLLAHGWKRKDRGWVRSDGDDPVSTETAVEREANKFEPVKWVTEGRKYKPKPKPADEAVEHMKEREW